jgi:hypothetical protein
VTPVKDGTITRNALKAMPRPGEVLADVLAGPNEVAQRFLLLGRHADERQPAGSELPGQQFAVAVVRS